MERSTLRKLAKLGAAAGLTLTFSLGLGSASSAASAGAAVKSEVREVQPGAGFEEVDSFTLFTRPHSWTPIDDDSVIVWATPFQPYLVELAFPSHDLRFASAIGVTSFGSRVYAKFDSIQVRGFRYPIDNIYKLTREEAKSLNEAS